MTSVLGEPNPVTAEVYIKFLLEKGLDFTPGTDFAYSNIGFCILGEVIEKITVVDYETYVKDNILSPIDICDIHLGKTLLEDKRIREVEYHTNFTQLSAFGTGEIVNGAYGGGNPREALSSAGGWIATARDLVRLLLAVDGFSNKPDILSPVFRAVMVAPSANNSGYAKGWTHTTRHFKPQSALSKTQRTQMFVNQFFVSFVKTLCVLCGKMSSSVGWTVNASKTMYHAGSISGSRSYIGRTQSGYTWAIILNATPSGSASAFATDFEQLPYDCIASTASYPDFDLLASPTLNSSAISFSNILEHSVDVNWVNGNGAKRILVVRKAFDTESFPLDGVTYAGNNTFGSGDDLGGGNFIVFNGSQNQVTVSGLEADTEYRFQVYDYAQDANTGDWPLYLLCNSPAGSVTTAGPLAIGPVSNKINSLYI